jgi:hypothetical protein
MIKSITIWRTLLALLLGLSGNAFSGDEATPRPMELSTIDFRDSWKAVGPDFDHKDFPRKALDALPQMAREDYESAFRGFRFMFLDLDGVPPKEILVTYSSGSGSGGHPFLILKEVSPNKWKLIADVLGGPVLSLHGANSNYYRLYVYYRSGSTYQEVYDYTKGSYKLSSKTKLPDVITKTCWWKQLWQALNADFNVGNQGVGTQIHRGIRQQYDCAPSKI